MRLFLVVVFVSLLIPAALWGQSNTIFVVESYHAAYPWDVSYKKGLEEVVGDTYSLEYYAMDTKRIAESEYQSRADIAWDHYLRIDPLLVVLADDNAVQLLGRRLSATTTPVVYLGVNSNPRNYGVTGHKNITGVLERPLLKRSVAQLKQLMPLQKVLLLFDSGTTAEAVYKEIFNGNDSVSFGSITVDIQRVDLLHQWKDAVQNAGKNGYDALILGLYHTIKDVEGQHVSASRIMEWTAAHTPVPPFAFWDFSVGPDMAIGGYVLFGEEQGRLAGQLVLKVLSGVVPGTIAPLTAPKGKFLFSRSQMQKWQISLPRHIREQSEFVE